MARTSLIMLVDFLSQAVKPDSVGVQEDGSLSDPVVVRVLTLDRVGRSRRDGPLLDLELAAAVECTGPRSLENVESMLTALEGSSRYAVAPLDPSVRSDAGVGFQVRMPVSLRLSEPEGPAIREPVRVVTVIGRQLRGVLVGADGFGIGGANIRSRASAVDVTSEADGRFELLSTSDPVQEFTVEFRGTTRTVSAPAHSLPLTIRWD